MPSKVEGVRQLNTFKQAKAYFKETIFKGLKDKVTGQYRRNLVANALSFSRTHKDCLVITADTNRDLITMGYNDKFITVDIKSEFLHTNQKVIRKILNKELKDEEETKETRQEFIQILNSLIFNFIEIINKPKEIKK
jgi:predicted Mrr-cat superfamily restriction endonuclease